MKRRSGSLQLSLDFLCPPHFSRDNLVVSSSNMAAVALIDSWPVWPSSLTILVGPEGSGKSHLSSIWRFLSSASSLNVHEVRPEFLPQGPFLLEDVDVGSFDDVSMFHLVNSVKEVGSYLLMTSRRLPSAWGVGLADLDSRLKTASIVQIQEPDDILLAGVLRKLFADRQIQVPLHVIDYIILRIERSLSAAILLVECLDRFTLDRKTGVTRSLASEALDSLEDALRHERDREPCR